MNLSSSDAIAAPTPSPLLIQELSRSTDGRPVVTLAELVINAGAYYQNPRVDTGLDKESMKELAADIKVRDIEDPIAITYVRLTEPTECEFATGKKHTVTGIVPLVVDGQRRCRGAVAAGYKPNDTIPVELATGATLPENAPDLDLATGTSWMLFSVRKFLSRQGLSSYELTQVAYRAREAGKSQDQIGKELNKSASWVSRFLAVKKQATPELEEAWREGKVTDEQAKDIAAVPKEKQAAEVKRITDVRASGDRAGKSTARQIAKTAAHEVKPNPVVKHTPPVQKALLELAQLRTECKPKDKYAAGVADGVAYAVGAIGDKDLGRGFTWWLEIASKSRLKKQAKEQSKKLTLEAQKAMAQKAKTKGKKKSK